MGRDVDIGDGVGGGLERWAFGFTKSRKKTIIEGR
jgi:hypothetical protein